MNINENKICKIAMAQMKVIFGDKEKNLENASKYVKEAAKENADIIILPECFDLGWLYEDKENIDLVPGITTDYLCNLSKDNNIYIVAGVIEKDEDKIYNTAVMISPQDGIILKHRKINVFRVARTIYSKGDSLRVVDTPWGKMGVSICSDNFLQTRCIADTMVLMGARAILSPCAWAVDIDYDNEKNPYGQEWINYYEPITTEHGIAIIGVSNIGVIGAGEWIDHPCIGCSIAMNKGRLIAKGKYNEEELIYIHI